MSCSRASLHGGAEGTRQVVHYAGRLPRLTDLQVSVVVLAQQLQEAQDVLHDADLDGELLHLLLLQSLNTHKLHVHVRLLFYIFYIYISIICACMSVCVHIHACVCLYVSIAMGVCVYMCECVCVRVCACACVFACLCV